MSEPETTQPIYYNSCFKHGVDDKRRVQIPAKWRPEQENTQLTVIVWPQHKAGNCLRVLPPAGMAKLAADIEAMPKGDPKKIALKRYIGSESVQVTLDKAGRIVLPEGVTHSCDIKNEAMFVGCIDSFEIWNPGRYENVKAADVAIASEAFSLID
jgi:MraZ protein